MKIVTIITVILISMILYGCQNEISKDQTLEMTTFDDQSGSMSENAVSDDLENASETEIPETSDAGTEVVQGGPYGKISLFLPDGWESDTCPADSGDLCGGIYGIRFYPEGVKEGYVELVYTDSFGVCGTGLETEETTMADMPAGIGTYDNHEYWSFITFQEDYEGIVALTYSVEDWWGQYGDRVMDIIDTMVFDRSVKEGSAYIYSAESEVYEIGVQFSLKKISGTGATLVFDQFDAKAPTGELNYGDDFVVEIQNNGKWETVPVVLEGEYGFNDIAYRIETEGTTETELNWEWLYGELSPGEYRIGKSVLDCRGSGDFDNYMIYAHFILN